MYFQCAFCNLKVYQYTISHPIKELFGGLGDDHVSTRLMLHRMELVKSILVWLWREINGINY